MSRSSVRTVFLALALPAVLPSLAAAQGGVLGTFQWQATPYCNQLTVQVAVDGPVFRMVGTDDRCGATEAVPISGTGVMQASGLVTLTFSSVGADGLPRHLTATIGPPTYQGTWTDNTGRSGVLTFGPSNGIGTPLPAARLTSSAIDTSAIGPAALAAGAVTSAAIADGAVGASDVDLTQVQARVGACGSGMFLQSVNQDGTANCATPAGAGDITAVTAGTGLTGGGSTGAVTLGIAAQGVTSAQIADAAVTSAKLAWPLSASTASVSPVLALVNAGSGPAFSAGATASGQVAAFTASSTSNSADAVTVTHLGTGTALAVSSTNASNAQPGVSITRSTAQGVGLSVSLNNGYRGIDVAQSGSGNAVYGNSSGGTAVWGISGTISGAGILGDNATGEAVVGRSQGGSGVGAVVGRNDSLGSGVRGFNTNAGTGVLGQAGVAGGTGTAGRFENVNAANSTTVLQVSGNGTGDLFSATQSGNVRFRVQNDGNVTADGAFTGGGADVAEFVEVTEELEPGDVVEIDPRHEGRFRRASGRATTTVAGVVTTRPGLLMNAAEGRTTLADGPALALAGRVPVKVTHEGGTIRPGDLLVAASTPGFARKAPARPKPGTVIGKALGRLDAPRGVVEMLVMLR